MQRVDDNLGLRVTAVTKSYRAARVLDGVTFSCPPGSVTGLLGPNGSGKSTIMRIMLDLARADQGMCTYDGAHFRTLPRPGRVVGAMIDPAAHHPGRSVRDTLAIAAIMAHVPLTRSREVVEALGLGSVSGRRFGALSLGMKQRVGLAIALLGAPRFLILDEPMNGLDVETASWLRETLVQQARTHGTTILLSTHLLEELQSFADRIVVLSRGVVVHEGPVVTPQVTQCAVATTEPDRLREALDQRSIGHSADPTPASDGGAIRLEIEAGPRLVGNIIRDERILIEELVGLRESIRDTYERMTRGEFRTGGLE